MTDAEPQPYLPFAPGDKLDRYELLCPIAEGGMACVWAARLRGLHGFEKLVAIKTILPRFAADARFREMFLEEARIVSRIEHPNVVRVLDLGEDRGLLYLVLEYIDGDTLSKLNRVCHKKGLKIPLGIALRVLADACAGLHEAHELRDAAGNLFGTVHRDVSPHNVLVDARGGVKLIDFGIAKTETSEPGGAPRGVLKGKVPYMSPEQALGRPVDRRTDIWGVGAILHHLIAGKVPYEGDSHETTLQLLGSGLPPSPLPHDVHPAVAAVSHRALAHEPAKRYASAAELRDALEHAMFAARCPASTEDVAAFVAGHLGERARRRHAAIARAAHVIAERERLDEATTGDPTRDSTPAAEVGAAPQRISEAPPGTTANGSLGPTALAPPDSQVRRGRRTAVVVGAFFLGFALVTGVSFVLLKPPRARSGGGPAAPGPAPSGPTAELHLLPPVAVPVPSPDAGENVTALPTTSHSATLHAPEMVPPGASARAGDQGASGSLARARTPETHQ